MGKKKRSFIDRKTATTYSLVYEDRDEEQDTQGPSFARTLAQPPVRGAGQQAAANGSEQSGRFAQPDYYYDDDSVYEEGSEFSMPRWAQQHDDEQYELSEERRRELVSLGFPDDGYDYLRHLRDLGHGRLRTAGPETILEGDEQGLEGFEGEEGELDPEDLLSDEDAGSDGDGSAEVAGGQGAAADASAVGIGPGPSTSTGAASAPSSAAADGTDPSGRRRGGSRAASVAGSVCSRRSVAASAAAAATGAGRAAAARSVAGSVAYSMRSSIRSHQQGGSGAGPSVFIPSSKFVAPGTDEKLIDARRLNAPGKAYSELEADAKAAHVSAMSRTVELKGKSGRLVQDLAELALSIAAMEVDDMRPVEVVEGEEWADWLDDFVAGGGDGEAEPEAAGAPGMPDSGSEEGSDEEGGDEDEEGQLPQQHQLPPLHPHKHSVAACTAAAPPTLQAAAALAAGRPQGLGLGGTGLRGSANGDGDSGEEGAADGDGGEAGPSGRAAGPAMSIASSYWRPERNDRKQGYEAIDARFDQLAEEYEDDELGDLDDDGSGGGEEGMVGGEAGRGGRARKEPARGTAELSDFADLLDECLEEQRAEAAHEALQQEGLRPLKATDRDEVALAASQPDVEAIAATKARLLRLEADAAAGGKGAAAPEDYPEDREVVVVQAEDRWDCESVLSLRSNLEHHPAKIVEPQRRTGARGGGRITLSAKTGMPKLEALQEGPGDEGPALQAGLDDEGASSAGDSGSGSEAEGVVDPVLCGRRKGETADERKARKAAVKGARRAQRAAKKEVKTMFKDEARKAHKQAAGQPGAARGGSTYVIP